MSSTILSSLEKTVLGLGIKYLPLPKTSPKDLYPPIDISLNKLHRSFRLAFYFADSPSSQSIIPKNETGPVFNPPANSSTDSILTDYITQLKSNVRSTLLNSRSLFSPTDNIILNTLTSLKKNTKITIKPSDKNLGLVILDTAHYKTLCLTHLNDITTYQEVLNYSPNHSWAKLKLLLSKLDLLHPKSNPKTLTKLATSLLQLLGHPTLRIPSFYILPKIHKNPMQSRPIVSSTSSMTYHASVYLDRLLQPVLKLLPTVCTSSLQLISDMELINCRSGSVILCADVTALYPNIPIDFGLSTVKTVLMSLKCFDTKTLDLVMSLLHWVLTNNYCTFNDMVYLQLKGTAMGTPVAVTYANIFLYGIESTILSRLHYTYYKRYIDDVFSIWDTIVLAQSYIDQFNAVCPSITFEAVTIGRSGVMLDLHVSLEEQTLTFQNGRSTSFDIISHKIYQKERNIYQYIPPMSEHKPAIFNNFVQQELRRYSISCTIPSDFNNIVDLFKQRLLARGYPLDLVTKSLAELPTRELLLRNLRKKAPSHRDDRVQPIVSLCVPRLSPPIKWGRLFQLPPYLTALPIFPTVFKTAKVIIGSKNPPTIGSYLIRSKFSDPPI